MLIILMNMRTVTWFSHGNNRIPLRPMISQGQCSTNWATRVRDLIPTAISIQGQWSTNWATCSLVPRSSNKIREERLRSIVCACAASQAFLGNLETTVTLVRVTPGIHCLCMCGFPGFSGELGNYCDTSPCCMTVRYWITGVVTSWRSSVRSTKLYRVPSVRLESQEWHWRTNNWSQYRTFMARTCLYGCQQIRQVHMYESYHLYSCLTSTLERQKWHISITDLQTMVLHSVATLWNCIFYWIFLFVNIHESRLSILTNYMEIVAELLAHARTVDTRLSSPICLSVWERG